MVAKQSAVARQSVAPKDRRRKTAHEGSLQSAKGKSSEVPALELDRLIHERMRLGIVSALAANASLTFNELKALMNTTDGNLSVHARKLEEANYISCSKFFEGRTPKTEFRITAAGRRALERYINHMEALIKSMRHR